MIVLGAGVVVQCVKLLPQKLSCHVSTDQMQAVAFQIRLFAPPVPGGAAG